MALARANLDRLLVAAAAAGLTLFYGLRNGLYDVVARGEAGLLIWIVLGFGWAFGLFPRARPARPLYGALVGFAALAVWTTISLNWTESDERTVVELGRVAHHAGVLLLAASVLTRRTWTWALGGIAAAVLVVCWLGLFNWLWPGSVAPDYARTVLEATRLSYPLDYFNGMATLGALTIVLSVAFAVHARHWWLRALVIAPVPGVAVMTYLTYSRGGAAELAVGLLVLFAASRHRAAALLVVAVAAAGSAVAVLFLRDHPQLVDGSGAAGAGGVMTRVAVAGIISAAVAAAVAATKTDERLRLPRRVGVPALAALGVAALIAAAVLGPRVVREAGRSFATQGTNSAANPTARFTSLGGGRAEQFKAAIDEWKRRPFEGTGPGTFEFTWDRSPRYTSFVRDVHNLYLESLSESGVPGLVAVLVLLVSAVVIVVLAVLRATDAAARGAAAAAAAMLAIFLVAAAVDWVWELTALPFVVLTGVGAAAAGVAGDRVTERLRAGRILVPVVAVLALAAILPPVVSQSELRRSQQAARQGNREAALRHATDAIDAAPWSATAMAQKSLLLESAGKLRAAEGYAILAGRREPTNWRYALLRSRLLAAQNQLGPALTWFRRAKAMAPRNPALQ